MKLKRYLLIFFLVLAGCSHPQPQWDSEAPYLPDRPPELGDILHTRTGHYLDAAQLQTSLSYFPLVYVGETHDNPASHRLQLDILEAMQSRHPGKMSLGMEMFHREQQPALDRWISGELTEKELLRESRWFDNWGHDFELYRELLEFCRVHQIPVIALNVAPEFAREVSKLPLEEHDAATRDRLPEMDLSDPYQRAMVEGVFSGHDAGSSMIEPFHRQQTLWDETMAESVARYMQANPERRMLVVAGGWHVRYGFGVPRRVHRRLPLPFATVGGHDLVVSEGKQAQLMNVDIPDFPMPPVDYLVFQSYEVFEPRGVRIGVMLENGENQAGVRVSAVMPGSVAERSGIQADDVVTGFDGVQIRDSFDLIHAARTRTKGGVSSIEIKRGEERLTLQLSFEHPAPASRHSPK